MTCRHGRSSSHGYQDTRLEVDVRGGEGLYRWSWCKGPVGKPVTSPVTSPLLHACDMSLQPARNR